MKSEFEIAITQLSADRNLTPEVILEAIEAALISAYKRNYGSNQNVDVTIHPRTGQAQVYVHKTVVEEVEDELSEIALSEARVVDPTASLGDEVAVEVKPRNFGRIAAQTAKQVITQRIREAERDSVYQEYFERAGEIVNATVRNIDGRTQNAVLNLGKAEALLPRSEQILGEHYRFGQRLRVYIVEVERSAKGPQIIVSRAHRDLLRRLLELEVPEIYNGTVEIKSIAREPGFRSKVAVAALQAGVDPVGSCVGMRGVRIQNIVNELSGEKIDVVAWSSDERTFIANALSPAKVVTVYLNPLEKTAKVVVPDRSLSLAIGKEGQNARLAAKLTGWRIDIKSEAEAVLEADQLAAEMKEAEHRTRELEEARRAAAELLARAQASLDLDEDAGDEEEMALEAGELIPAQVYEQAPVAEAELQPELMISADEVLADVPTELVWQEEPIEQSEPIVAPQPSDAEDKLPVEEALVVEALDEDEDSEEDRAERDRRKKRGRYMEFDERLGRVVVRKQRKRSSSSDWDTWDDE
jgi:N utilization substance protein A